MSQCLHPDELRFLETSNQGFHLTSASTALQRRHKTSLSQSLVAFLSLLFCSDFHWLLSVLESFGLFFFFSCLFVSMVQFCYRSSQPLWLFSSKSTVYTQCVVLRENCVTCQHFYISSSLPKTISRIPPKSLFHFLVFNSLFLISQVPSPYLRS